MSLTITWTDTNDETTTYTVPDSAYNSLEAYRLSMTHPVLVDDVLVDTPNYATVQEMIVATFIRELIQPAFTAFPPAEIDEQVQDANAANAALAAAKAAAILNALVQA